MGPPPDLQNNKGLICCHVFSVNPDAETICHPLDTYRFRSLWLAYRLCRAVDRHEPRALY